MALDPEPLDPVVAAQAVTRAVREYFATRAAYANLKTGLKYKGKVRTNMLGVAATKKAKAYEWLMAVVAEVESAFPEAK